MAKTIRPTISLPISVAWIRNEAGRSGVQSSTGSYLRLLNRLFSYKNPTDLDGTVATTIRIEAGKSGVHSSAGSYLRL